MLSLSFGLITYVCRLSDQGAVYSWGAGFSGQLGRDSDHDEHTPALVDVLDGKRMVYIACGAQHSAALSDNGRLSMWGSNEVCRTFLIHVFLRC